MTQTTKAWGLKTPRGRLLNEAFSQYGDAGACIHDYNLPENTKIIRVEIREIRK